MEYPGLGLFTVGEAMIEYRGEGLTAAGEWGMGCSSNQEGFCPQSWLVSKVAPVAGA